jgi:hypothetical protein
VRLQDEAALQYLAQNGVKIGGSIKILEKSPLDGQVSLQVRRGRQLHVFSLGAVVAAGIEAQLI